MQESGMCLEKLASRKSAVSWKKDIDLLVDDAGLRTEIELDTLNKVLLDQKCFLCVPGSLLGLNIIGSILNPGTGCSIRDLFRSFGSMGCRAAGLVASPRVCNHPVRSLALTT